MGVSAIRLPKEIERAIDDRIKEEKIDKSTAMKQFLIIGIKEYKKQRAVELYRAGKISLSEAARIASVNVYEMIEFLIKAGIQSEYSVEDMKREGELLKKMLKR